MILRIKQKLNNKYSLFRNGSSYRFIKKINALRRVRDFVGGAYGTWQLSRFRLHGDGIHLVLLRKIVSKYKITSIVETGTFLGYTTKLFAKEFPNLQIYTAEINKCFYRKAKKNLRRYDNIHLYNSTSPEFLNSIIKNKLVGNRPLFYLDAHWLDDWPLEKELQIISRKLTSAVISIDDFKVEGDSRFVYDKYNGKECSLDLVNDNLGKNEYNLLFPNYSKDKIFKNKLFHPNLIGYVILFQNMVKEFNILKNSIFVKTNYLDKSNMVNIRKVSAKKK